MEGRKEGGRKEGRKEGHLFIVASRKEDGGELKTCVQIVGIRLVRGKEEVGAGVEKERKGRCGWFTMRRKGQKVRGREGESEKENERSVCVCVCSIASTLC